MKCKRFGKGRHDALAEAADNLARSAGLQSRREPVGILQDGTSKRPGDVLLPTFDRGAIVALDFRVTNNKQAILLGQALRVGRASRFGYQQKMTRWHARCAAVNVKFIPMSVDTYGYWHEESRAVLFEIAKRRSHFTERDPDLEFKYSLQLLSTILQRENARILIEHKQRPQVFAEEESEAVILIEDELVPSG